MKKINLLVAMVCLCVANAFAGSPEIIEKYVTPTRVMWTSDKSGNYVKNADILTEPFSGQVAVNDNHCVVMKSDASHTASLLIDFGKEMHAGLKIFAGIRPNNKPVSIRVTYGESVTEAMSQIARDGKKNPTNDHAMREFTIQLPWLGSATTGFSGFRFVRIDLLDKDVEFDLRAVQAIHRFRDYDYLGTFKCDNERLNKIWSTAAYTVQENMQEYIWDGIKRDRLVWLGDLNPEILTICNVFGSPAFDLVHKALDFGSTGYPLPQWQNGMPSYSLWWIINQYDLFMYEGNLPYLKAQLPYIKGLVEQVAKNIDPKTGREKIKGGFLDWPTSPDSVVVHAGMQALCIMTFDAAKNIGTYTGDQALVQRCEQLIKLLRKHRPDHHKNTQASSLYVLSGLSKDPKKDAQNIINNGMDQYSTFYGYYATEALARTGHYQQALDDISKYWGAMLDLGATTFWEDLTYKFVANAGRIDEFVPEGKYDIHADGGDFCYKGLRLSLAHGWASGPAIYLTQNVLGVRPVEPGCKTIKVTPHLGNLNWAEGTFPTPQGIVKIKVTKDANGKAVPQVEAPAGVKVVYE